MKKDDDLRAIVKLQSVMNEKLDAISKDLNDPKTGLVAINDRLEDPKTGLKKINEKMDALWEQVEKVTFGVDHLKEVSKNQSKSLNRSGDNIRRIDSRLSTIESHSGIVPPPELVVFE